MSHDEESAGRAAIGPRSLPAAPAGLQAGAPRLYLDQKVWVWLLKGSPAALREKERLADAVERGRAVVCLSAAHYAETWHRGRWESRWALARLMWDVSRLITLAPVHALLAGEVALAMLRLGVGLPEPPAPTRLVGLGVNHAFACPTGRLRLVETIGTDGQEGPPVPLEQLPPLEQAIYGSGCYAYEWLSLAGAPRDMRVDGLDLHKQRRDATRFAENERELATLLARRSSGVTLGEALTGHDLGWIWEPLCEVCEQARLDPNKFLYSIAAHGGRGAVEAFVRAMPSFGLLHDLRVLRHQNPQQPWQANDHRDLLALSVAATHCQAVVTERHWAHLFTRLGIERRTGTHVTSSLAVALDRVTRG